MRPHAIDRLSFPVGGHKGEWQPVCNHISPFSEENKLEAVVPLTKPKRAREILDKSEQYLGGNGNSGGGSGGQSTDHSAAIAAAVQSFLEKAAGAFDKIERAVVNALESVTPAAEREGGTDAGSLSAVQSFLGRANEMLAHMSSVMGTSSAAVSNSSVINHNNHSYDMRTTVNVSGNADNPQDIGKSVSRAQQIMIRNQQGVIV